MEKDALERVLDDMLKSGEIKNSIGPKGEMLLGRLQAIRERGYALNNEEFIPGLRAIGAPVFDASVGVEGAINMPVFS